MLHSAALRRLAGKTQVVGPGEGAEVSGVPRTRLTHSWRSPRSAGRWPRSWAATRTWWTWPGWPTTSGTRRSGTTGSARSTSSASAAGGFEGNAQTLRILTRLEPKIGGSGLNLTRAALDATCKYPWIRADGDRKYGAYPEDAAAFDWVREGAPERRRCIEAQVMDWADDVAYSVHDVEDGVLSGRIDLAALGAPAERAALVELAARYFGTRVGGPESAALSAAADELIALPVVHAVRGFDAGSATAAAHGALKRLTSELVGRFVRAATDATRAAHRDRPLRRYAADLVVPPRAAAEVALLKAMALRYVMSDPDRLAMQARQRELLAELAAALLDGRPARAGPGVRRGLGGRARRRRPAAGRAGPGRRAHRPAGGGPARHPHRARRDRA